MQGTCLRRRPEFPCSLYGANRYDARMALVRILVDGYRTQNGGRNTLQAG
jgi:hypothetical protein